MEKGNKVYLFSHYTPAPLTCSLHVQSMLLPAQCLTPIPMFSSSNSSSSFNTQHCETQGTDIYIIGQNSPRLFLAIEEVKGWDDSWGNVTCLELSQRCHGAIFLLLCRYVVFWHHYLSWWTHMERLNHIGRLNLTWKPDISQFSEE